MRHTITIEGRAFRLRPVAVADAAFIVSLRNDPRLNQFVHPVSPRVEDQERWLARCFERLGDYYFIIERVKTGQPEGTVGLYDLDDSRRCAEWGRWVLRSRSMGALESAQLIYRVAFNVLGLDWVYCRTLVDNVKVVSFHETFGLETHERLPGQFVFNGVPRDAIEQRITRERWEKQRASVEAKMEALARILSR